MDQERELAARAAVRAGEATGSEHWSRSAQAHFASLRFDEPAAALVVAAGPAAEGGGDCASFQLVNDGMREAEVEAAGFIRKASCVAPCFCAVPAVPSPTHAPHLLAGTRWPWPRPTCA